MSRTRDSPDLAPGEVGKCRGEPRSGEPLPSPTGPKTGKESRWIGGARGELVPTLTMTTIVEEESVGWERFEQILQDVRRVYACWTFERVKAVNWMSARVSNNVDRFKTYSVSRLRKRKGTKLASATARKLKSLKKKDVKCQCSEFPTVYVTVAMLMFQNTPYITPPFFRSCSVT